MLIGVMAAGIAASFWAGRASAGDAKPAGFSASMTAWGALKAAGESRVNLTLQGGAQYSAKVKDLSSTVVVLKEPAGKEFFEVYVPLEQLVAIELKVK